MLFWSHKGVLRTVLVVLSVVPFAQVQGAAQYAGLDIGVSALSDDNYGLSAYAKNDVSGSRVQARATLRWETELSKLALNGRIVDENLNVNDVDESDVLQLSVDGNHRLRRGNLMARASVIQDTNLTDDALSAGVSLIDVGRDRYTAVFSAEQFFTETQGVSLSAYGESVRFEEYSPNLSEYDYTSLDARYLWAMRETLTAYISGVISRVEYEDDVRLDLALNGRLVPGRTNIESGSLGVSWLPADKWSVDAGFGYRQTEYLGSYYFFVFPWVYRLESEEEGDGRTTDLSVQYQGERAFYNVKFSQEITPNTSGSLVDEKRLEVAMRMQFSERMRLKLRAYVSEQRSEIYTDNRDNIDVAYGLVGLDWKLNKSISVRGDYRYINRKFINSNNDTESNRVTLGLYWTPGQLQW